ncbi:hypothetical protein [Shewanella surugensis]|uniref:Flagellin n=1 Tax=Shewanella surugensis TaxID=212020 RepID=A0ABT0LAP7_9GAMM|nr:hypothetical protein [Shewanella surugensis]MCL1124778.1 hypothetical protein [Shewanella surugensis]
MINGVTDSLNVQQRSQTVSAPISERSQYLPSVQANVSSIPTHRLESYVRWAKVTQGQHKISAAQVAEQSLKQVVQLLKQLKKQVQLSLKNTPSIQTEPNKVSLKLQQRLVTLKPEYQGKALLDHQLNVISATHPASPRQFRLKSVELTQSKARDERISIQIGGAVTNITLPANLSQASLSSHLAASLKPLGIQLQAFAQQTASKIGPSLFNTHEQQWLLIKEGIFMTGQGQRLPAGEPRLIKVIEELNWQDPREWKFTSQSELKQSMAKISKSLSKIELQLKDLGEVQQKVRLQLKQINNGKQQDFDLQSTLQRLNTLMQPSPFTAHIRSLMAQANVNRNQVSSLLG